MHWLCIVDKLMDLHWAIVYYFCIHCGSEKVGSILDPMPSINSTSIANDGNRKRKFPTAVRSLEAHAKKKLPPKRSLNMKLTTVKRELYNARKRLIDPSPFGNSATDAFSRTMAASKDVVSSIAKSGLNNKNFVTAKRRTKNSTGRCFPEEGYFTKRCESHY